MAYDHLYYCIFLFIFTLTVFFFITELEEYRMILHSKHDSTFFHSCGNVVEHVLSSITNAIQDGFNHALWKYYIYPPVPRAFPMWASRTEHGVRWVCCGSPACAKQLRVHLLYASIYRQDDFFFGSCCFFFNSHVPACTSLSCWICARGVNNN